MQSIALTDKQRIPKKYKNVVNNVKSCICLRDCRSSQIAIGGAKATNERHKIESGRRDIGK